MSNAQNTYNAAMATARAELAAAFDAYNASEWSIEAQIALDAAQTAYTIAQYDAQTALTMQSAAEQIAAIHAAADAMTAAINAEMTTAHFAYRNSEWTEEAAQTFEAICAANVKAQQEVNAFRNTYGNTYNK